MRLYILYVNWIAKSKQQLLRVGLNFSKDLNYSI